MALDFVITGTGRCGTASAAALMNANGVACGHETYYRHMVGIRGLQTQPRHSWAGEFYSGVLRWKEQARRSRLRLCGDSSWMACPYLGSFAGLKVLLVREPLATIRSFTGTRFFSGTSKDSRQRAFAAAYFGITGDDLCDAMRWWWQWNEMALEHADLVVRLESLESDGIPAILERLERAPSPSLGQAVARVGARNSGVARGEVPLEIDWLDLRNSRDYDNLKRVAETVGYEVP